MPDLLPEWDLFAAAWLAKTIVVPPPHGETAEIYAAKQCDLAAAMADRMLALKAMRTQAPMPAQRVTQPSRLLAGILGVPLAQDVAHSNGATPTANALTGQPCWRAYNGRQRGQGEDCVGVYDDQGICKSCRLAYHMPGDAPKPAFSPSYGPPPLPPPSGPPTVIGQVSPQVDGTVPPPAFPPAPPPAFPMVPPGAAS